MMSELDLKPSDVSFLEVLNWSKNTVIFKVAIHGKICVMKVYHDRGKSDWDPVNREVNLFLCESSAYRRLKEKGFCERGVVPDFYGIIANIQPTLWPHLYMFLDDKLPPNAIIIEYIPNMKQIDLSNFSRQRVETFRDILFQMHQANILHGDPKPRNMMIAKNRVLWIDFDSAQTFLEDQALTSIQHKWFKEEVELMEYFVEALFETSFCELWETIPTKWRSRLKMNQNRLYSQLRKERKEHKVKVLEESAENEIWSWGVQPEKFYQCGSSAMAARTGPNSKPLDAIISLLTYLKSQMYVDVVRWRLSLLFIAETVDGKFADISDTEVLVDLLVQHSFISDESRGDAVRNLSIWLRAGRKYKVLADELGGRGALVYLPHYACTTYEEHFHPAGEDGRGVIDILQRSVPDAAAQKRKCNLNAHSIADTIYFHKFEVFQVTFVNFSPKSHERAKERPAKRVRRRRRKARYDTQENVGSAGLARAPPIMTGQVLVWRLQASNSAVDDANNQAAGVVAQNKIPPAVTTCGNSQRAIGQEPRENTPPLAVHRHWAPSKNLIPVSNSHLDHGGTSLSWAGRSSDYNLSLASSQRDPVHEPLLGQINENHAEQQPAHESLVQPTISVNDFRNAYLPFPETDTTQREERHCHARPPNIPPIPSPGSGSNITSTQASTHQHFRPSVTSSHLVEPRPVSFVQTALPRQQPLEFLPFGGGSHAHSEQEFMMNNLDLDWDLNLTTMVDVGSSQRLDYLSENLDYGWVQLEAQ
ncbi:hypothetical protein CNMCM8927_003566 [Aspergillus lentulus]|uniref:Protein kinase domain-containing protein n=1 Tax=Aspergillus lentulus TaxID=293939 RepID=A0AAN5YSK3_ASPLE|nr:hypothetical protein CNMCM8927_003566 [Aspergillus lentulus]